jgi:hypothetical protein
MKKEPNRSNMRHTKPLQGLFEQKPTGILAMGVHILCADKKIREVEMNPKLADKILGLIKHVHGGAIHVSAHTLEVYLIPPPEPVSRDKGVDAYVPLARQLPMGTLIQADGGPCMCDSCVGPE